MKRLAIKFYDTSQETLDENIRLYRTSRYLNRYYVAFMIVRVTNKANSVSSKRDVSVSAVRLQLRNSFLFYPFSPFFSFSFCLRLLSQSLSFSNFSSLARRVESDSSPASK